MSKIRILVASDYQIMRSALRHLLTTVEVFDILPTETDIGKGLACACQTLSPDVLLLEASNSSSLRVPANVLTAVPNARIVLLSTNDNTSFVCAAFATGVLGYVLKSAAQSDLFEAVNRVHRGCRFLDPGLSNSVPGHFLRPMVTATGWPSGRHLSPREIEVLRAIALGFTTKEISKELDLSEKTVQTYRERIYKKLALHSRADLVHYALAYGFWRD